MRGLLQSGAVREGKQAPGSGANAAFFLIQENRVNPMGVTKSNRGGRRPGAGREPLKDAPMTAAERKRRSRK